MARRTCPSAGSRLTIDLDALRENYATVSHRIAPAMCGAVVKANAYGLGALPVVGALRRAGCTRFFTAHLAEALDLAPALDPTCHVFILNGLDPDCEPLCAEHGFLPVLNSLAQVERWRALAIAQRRRLPAALQVDSGMSRLGLSPIEAATLSETSVRDDVDLRLIMTHLVCADEPDRSENRGQLERFEGIARRFPGVAASIANSGGVFLTRDFHMDIVRCGIALFGIATSSSQSCVLRSVVRLDARVVQIRLIDAGNGIGYGLDHVARRPMRIATIGIGYADGVPRRFSERGGAWYQNHWLPIVGRISMDSLTLDASNLPDDLLHDGAFVEFIGSAQPIEVIAESADTIPYEILTGFGRRHERLYLENNHMERYGAGAWS